MPEYPDLQNLPKIVQQYIERLARRVGNRHMRRDVLAELHAHFADILAPEKNKYDKDKKVTILYRTVSGQAFLDAVTP